MIVRLEINALSTYPSHLGSHSHVIYAAASMDLDASNDVDISGGGDTLLVSALPLMPRMSRPGRLSDLAAYGAPPPRMGINTFEGWDWSRVPLHPWFATFGILDSLSDVCADDVARIADVVIAMRDGVAEDVAAVPRTQATFANTVDEMFGVDQRVQAAEGVVTILWRLGSSAEVRKAAEAARLRIKQANLASRGSVLQVMNYVSISTYADDVERRLFGFALRAAQRSGMLLSDAGVKARLEHLRSQEVALGVEFGGVLSADDAQLHFTRAQLAGMPADYLGRLKVCKGSIDELPELYIVTTSYADVLPLLRLCTVRETRKAVYTTFESRGVAGGNLERLGQLSALRHEAANLLGYATHADFQMAVCCAGSLASVRHMLDVITPTVQAQLAEAMMRTKALAAIDGVSDEQFGPWDVDYYRRLDEAQRSSLDHGVIREGLTLAAVLPAMFRLFEDLFELSITLTAVPAEWQWAGPTATQLCVISDAAGALYGYVIMDLHPRPGKYSHCMVSPIVVRQPARAFPMVALICNFPDAHKDGDVSGNSAHLEHDDVLTLLHEFGHAVHWCVSTATETSLSAFETEMDFLEVPSQMMEGWGWHAPTLVKLSGQRIPLSAATALTAMRAGYMLHDMGRMVVRTNTDLYMHTGARTTEDLVAFYRQEHERVLGYAAPPDPINALAAFDHVASDYDARYFGYLWSMMAATDIFRQFAGDNDAATGVRYRKCVLEPGATLDGADMIRSFLGRDPCPHILLSLLE